MNCRVSDDHTESYLSATRCQPSCSNRAKSSWAVMAGISCRKQMTLRTAKPLQLLERKFDSLFLFASYEFVSLNDAGAGVPPQNRIVVTKRAERFGFFEPVHCFAQKIVRLTPTARRVLA